MKIAAVQAGLWIILSTSVGCGYGLDGVNYEKRTRSKEKEVERLEHQLRAERLRSIDREFERNSRESAGFTWSYSDTLFMQLPADAGLFCESKGYGLPDQKQVDELFNQNPQPEFLDNFMTRSGRRMDICLKDVQAVESCAALCVKLL